MNKSEQIDKLAQALCAMQKDLIGPTKDSSNPFYKSKYADLASVWEAIRDPMTKNGLSVLQTMSGDVEKVVVETVLLHVSGQYISGSLTLVPAKPHDPQSVGSAITYGRRYSLMAILCVAPEDDDGNSASGTHTAPQTKQQPAPPKTETKIDHSKKENDAELNTVKKKLWLLLEGAALVSDCTDMLPTEPARRASLVHFLMDSFRLPPDAQGYEAACNKIGTIPLKETIAHWQEAA